jgi:hypothetical protein
MSAAGGGRRPQAAARRWVRRGLSGGRASVPNGLCKPNGYCVVPRGGRILAGGRGVAEHHKVVLGKAPPKPPCKRRARATLCRGRKLSRFEHSPGPHTAWRRPCANARSRCARRRSWLCVGPSQCFSHAVRLFLHGGPQPCSLCRLLSKPASLRACWCEQARCVLRVYIYALVDSSPWLKVAHGVVGQRFSTKGANAAAAARAASPSRVTRKASSLKGGLWRSRSHPHCVEQQDTSRYWTLHTVCVERWGVDVGCAQVHAGQGMGLLPSLRASMMAHTAMLYLRCPGSMRLLLSL